MVAAEAAVAVATTATTAAASQSQSPAQSKSDVRQQRPRRPGSRQCASGVRQVPGACPGGGRFGRSHPGRGLLAVRRPLFPHDPDHGRLRPAQQRRAMATKKAAGQTESAAGPARSAGRPTGRPAAQQCQRSCRRASAWAAAGDDVNEAEPGLGGVAFLQNGRSASSERGSGGRRSARGPGVHAAGRPARRDSRSGRELPKTPEGSRRRVFFVVA